MIKEVLVVEGKQDVEAIRRAKIDADCIITGGFSLGKHTMDAIDKAYDKRGIIILTDPDSAGERIRRYLTKRYPLAKHAFISREEASANDDIGVEQASPASIVKALNKVMYVSFEASRLFCAADLLAAGLSGSAAAALQRDRVGSILGVGYANAKTFLRRLNTYGVTREEFLAAVKAAKDEGEHDDTANHCQP